MPNLNPWRDDLIADAAADVIGRKLGLARSDEHPLAREMQHLSYPELAGAVARANGRRPSGAQTTSDLAPVLKDVFQRLVAQSYAATADHRRICKDIGLPDFRPAEFPSTDIVIDDAGAAKNEAGEWLEAVLFVAAGLTGQVSQWGRIFGVSDVVLKNDTLGTVAAGIGNLGAFAARRESKSVFGLLVSNPILADTRALFNAVDGNLMTASPLNAANLGIGCAKLRRQKTLAGNAANNAARFLVVAPEQEVAALELVRTITARPEAPPLDVIAAPELPDGTWCLLADPIAAPVVGFLTLQGGTTFAVSQGRLRFAFAGAGFKIEMRHGVVALSRIGALKATA